MSLARRFNLIACIAVVTACLSYTIADGRPFLAMLAIIGTIGGYLAGRQRPVWVLPRFAVNIFVLLAIINAATSAGAVGRGGAIVSVLAEFLVYIQLIKLFDRRSPRDELHLLTLSVFLVIGAVLTSNTLGTGLILMLYVPIAITAGMVLQLHAGERVVLEGRPTEAAVEPAPISSALRRDLRRTARFSIAATFGLAVGAFLVVPRGLGREMLGTFGKAKDGGGAVVGFTPNIRLGNDGFLSPSDDTPVLGVSIEDEQGMPLGKQMGSLYLRGSARSYYNGAARTWQEELNPPPVHFPGNNPNARTKVFGTEGMNRLRQRITFKAPNKDGFLFALWHPLNVGILDRDWEVDPGRDLELKLINMSDHSRLSYSVLSALEYTTGEPPRERITFPLERVGDLAREILEARNIPADPALRDTAMNRGAALSIQSYLREKYAYTLKMEGPRAGEDPIEMFLFRTEAGHCEYFASAMVAMCQSVGLDARLIAGYLGSEYNDLSGEYVVRRSDAHAWVEACVSPGRWQVFDPSPPASINRIHGAGVGIVGRIRQFWEALELGWINSIVTFDESKRGALMRVPKALGLDKTRDHMEAAARWLRMMATAATPAQWIRLVAGGILVSFLVLQGMRRYRRYRRWRAEEDLHSPLFPREPVAIPGWFERAETALAAAGMGRGRSTPPLSYTRTLEATDPAVAVLWARLAGLYYRVRYSGHPLSPAETAGAEGDAERLRALALAAKVRETPVSG